MKPSQSPNLEDAKAAVGTHTKTFSEPSDYQVMIRCPDGNLNLNDVGQRGLAGVQCQRVIREDRDVLSIREITEFVIRYGFYHCLWIAMVHS